MSLRLAKAGGANKFKPSRPAPKKTAPISPRAQSQTLVPSSSAAPDEATSSTFNNADDSQDTQVPSYTQDSESLPDLTQASSIAPSTQPPQTQEDPSLSQLPTTRSTISPDKSSKGNAFAFGSLASLEASHTADPKWIPVPQSADSRPSSRAITPSMPLDTSLDERTAPATASTSKDPGTKFRKRKASPAKASEDTANSKQAKKPKSSDKGKGKKADTATTEAADIPVDGAAAAEAETRPSDAVQVGETDDTGVESTATAPVPGTSAVADGSPEAAEEAQSEAHPSKEAKKSKKTPKPSSKRKRVSAVLSEPDEPEPEPEMQSQPADEEASEPVASTSAVAADDNDSSLQMQSQKAQKSQATSKRKRAVDTAADDEASHANAYEQEQTADSTSETHAKKVKKGKGKAKAQEVALSELAEGNAGGADMGDDVLNEIRGFIEAAESEREPDGGRSGASDDEVSDTGTEGVENVLLDMAAGRRNSLRSRKKSGQTTTYQADEPPEDEDEQESEVEGEPDADADASAAKPKTARKKKTKKAGETEDEAEYVSGAESSTKQKKAQKPKKEKPPPMLGPDGQPVKRGRGRPRKDPSELAKNKRKAAARKLKKPKAVPGLSDGEDEEAENAADEEGGEEYETRQLGPLDPSRVTMAALIKDTGRGQISRFMRKKMEDKANQRLRMKNARERMRKKAALEREGISADEVQRRLDEEENDRGSAAPDPGSPGADREGTADQQDGDEDDVAPERGDDEQEEGEDGGVPSKQDASQFSFRAPKNLLEGNYIGNEQAERGDVEDEAVEPDSDDEGMPAASRHGRRVQDSAQPTENGHDGEEGQEDDYEGLQETQFAPQMKLVDGEWVVDEASTQIARGPDAHTRYENVAEEDVRRRVTSYTDGRAQKRRVDRIAAGNKNGKWSKADTELFYEGLSQFGTDFELIAGMFAYRDRRQIKNKWDREEKKCPERIDEALKVKKKINISFYEEVTSWDLSNGPIPADPMHRYYEGLPTLEEKVKLESNRAPSNEPEILARKKEESSRPAGEDGEAADGDGDGQAEDGDRPLFNPDSDAEQEADDGEAAEQEEGQEAREEEEGEGEEGEPEAEEQDEQEAEAEGEAEGGAGAEEEEPFDFSALGGIAIKSTA